MKKLITIVFLSFYFSHCVFSNDSLRYNQCNVYKITSVNGVTKDSFLIKKIFFNKYNQIVLENEFSSDGKLISEKKMTYRERLLIGEEENYFKDGNSKKNYYYSENEKVCKIVSFENGLVVSQDYYYYKDTLLQQVLKYQKLKSFLYLSGREIKKYNGNVLLNEFVINNVLDTSFISTYVYNSNFKLDAYFGISPFNDTLEHYKVYYDTCQRIKKKIFLISGEIQSTEIFFYNNKELKTKEVYNYANKLIYKEDFFYYENEKLKQKISTDFIYNRVEELRYSETGQILAEINNEKNLFHVISFKYDYSRLK